MTTKRVEKAAKRFFSNLLPGERFDHTESKTKSLIVSAFDLYARAWGTAYNVENWEWPHTTLAEAKPFEGDEPWTVLFRRAVEIGRGDQIAPNELLDALLELQELHKLANTAPTSSRAAFDAHIPLDRVKAAWANVDRLLALSKHPEVKATPRYDGDPDPYECTCGARYNEAVSVLVCQDNEHGAG